MAEKKFYQMTVDERLDFLRENGVCEAADLELISGRDPLSEERADHMIENVIGRFSLPIGLAQNFVINGKAYPIPMVIEEPSVVAAASNAAKIVKACGGFTAEADEPRMIGQMQIVQIPDLAKAAEALRSHKAEILAKAAECDPFLLKIGGGPRDMEVRVFEDSDCGPMLVLHLILDVRDAMGANAINSALEKAAPLAESLTGGKVRLRILSNLAEKRLARAFCRITPEALSFKTYDGADVIDRILDAAAFAEADPYRAATHNKGIMNGIDAVAIPLGNDWRAIEAGAHSWAAVSGTYKPLSHWHKDAEGCLRGSIELPMTVGTFGGATRVHPAAGANLRMMGIQSARELAAVLAAVGLAQNLAAIKALSTEGIQKGHMALHARQVAIAAGASGSEIDRIAAIMVEEKHIAADYAKELLK